ncbi:recombinase family protein [Asanoa sp. WMMD1127]|uniref:recombinase family protein n=1 Tax=Asanoa sp. WMMD1127 TaxID=3016107 RepID=UPI0024169909|nr:recombinase family protein [Asanoa sp. WMMD1127]MDG4821267.1 recombinase family protein [Asanoa sp. WMMD1127]
MTTFAGIYARISDDREGLAHGVDSQLQDGRALCEREGLAIYDTYVDNDLSASTKARRERPDYQRLLADARAGRVQVIVSLSSSRLTRTPREHEDQIELAQRHGTRYLFGKSPALDLNTADGRMVARMLASTDAAEAERTQERVRREARRRAEAGEFHGGRRGYGITADGTGVVEDEAERIREWAEHVMAGGALETLARRLNDAGQRTPAGATWRANVIRRTLLAPRVAGLRVLDGAEFKAPNPAILTPEVWRAVVARLTDPARRTNRRGTARAHLGIGLYRCQRCDAPVRTDYHRNGSRIYKCRQCSRSWSAERLDAFILKAAEAELAREDTRKRLLPETEGRGDLTALRIEADAIAENLAVIAVDAATAKNPRVIAALRKGIAEGEERLAEIEAILTAAASTDGLAGILRAKDPVAAFRALDDLGRRQTVIRALMEVWLGQPVRGRTDPAAYLGGSRWTGDTATWADHWQG